MTEWVHGPSCSWGGSILAVGLVASACVVSFGQLIVVYGVVMTLGAHGLGLVVFVPLLSGRWLDAVGAWYSRWSNPLMAWDAPSPRPLVQFLIATLGWRRAYRPRRVVTGGPPWPAGMVLAGPYPRRDGVCA